MSLLHVIEAVYKAIPEKFHNMLEHSYTNIEDVMKAAASAVRSLVIHLTKLKAHAIFNDIPVSPDILNSAHRQATSNWCLCLLGYDMARTRYKQCPELLYPIGEGDAASQCLFYSPTMVKILSVALHGASSITTGKPTKSTNDELWKVMEITAGRIAFAAIVVHFLLSADRSFVPMRERTKIPYSWDFEFYI
ncbi:hypothetical protein F5146DRAFT_1143190 [Armillaria mellea]|nr:hypothetical protein F5146DRAFT_1143190 [Armillaria mellea]